MGNEQQDLQKNPIQVSERIFHTIECLAQNGAMGLQELSADLGLNKSTVHRILNSLICMDYVRQDSETPTSRSCHQPPGRQCISCRLTESMQLI